MCAEVSDVCWSDLEVEVARVDGDGQVRQQEGQQSSHAAHSVRSQRIVHLLVAVRVQLRHVVCHVPHSAHLLIVQVLHEDGLVERVRVATQIARIHVTCHGQYQRMHVGTRLLCSEQQIDIVLRDDCFA